MGRTPVVVTLSQTRLKALRGVSQLCGRRREVYEQVGSATSLRHHVERDVPSWHRHRGVAHRDRYRDLALPPSFLGTRRVSRWLRVGRARRPFSSPHPLSAPEYLGGRGAIFIVYTLI